MDLCPPLTPRQKIIYRTTSKTKTYRYDNLGERENAPQNKLTSSHLITQPTQKPTSPPSPPTASNPIINTWTAKDHYILHRHPIAVEDKDVEKEKMQRTGENLKINPTNFL